jgi:hypothetical protein
VTAQHFRTMSVFGLICALSVACSSSTRHGGSSITTGPRPSAAALSPGTGGSSAQRPPVEASLTRPVVTIAGCRPSSAAESHETVTLFAWASLRRTVQVVADPTRRASGPYAIVERFFDNIKGHGAPGPTVVINGRPVRFYVGQYGQGAVDWILPDGSEGYVRTRGFNQAALVTLARALRPRPGTASVPGFDVASPARGRLAIVGETAGPLQGDNASFWCTRANGSRLMVSALRGNPVFQYGAALDALPLPLVAQRGDTVLVMYWPQLSEAAAFASVHNATPEQWALLLRGHPTQP